MEKEMRDNIDKLVTEGEVNVNEEKDKGKTNVDNKNSDQKQQ